jgi:branched-chain amino acid aminotransferase
VVTPPVSANILEGITRMTLFTLIKDNLDIEIVEREIDRTEMYSAEEVFLCGTGVQIAAVTSIDHRPVGTGKMGPIVGKLRDIYFDVVRGNLPRYQQWVQPVYSTESVSAD